MTKPSKQSDTILKAIGDDFLKYSVDRIEEGIAVCEDENGEMLVHAHNVFLQVIHDHGLITGVVFILFGIVSFMTAVFRFVKKNDWKLALTIAVILAFALKTLSLGLSAVPAKFFLILLCLSKRISFLETLFIIRSVSFYYYYLDAFFPSLRRIYSPT